MSRPLIISNRLEILILRRHKVKIKILICDNHSLLLNDLRRFLFSNQMVGLFIFISCFLEFSTKRLRAREGNVTELNSKRN